MVKRYKGLRHFLVEDYYPLFVDYGADPLNWDGWQFHDSKKDEGFFLAFRPPGSSVSEETIKLRGLDPAKQYHLRADRKTDLPDSVSGKVLRDGLTVRIDSPRQALLVRY